MKNLAKLAGFALAIGSTSAAANARQETAVLAGGCYWGMEAVFDHVVGVREAVAGFAGASTTPVGRNTGDHNSIAEAVRITFDPSVISYEQLLDIFFTVAHDPSQVDRQGPDVGHKYRSAIFPQTREQRDAAARAINALRAAGRTPRVATRIESGGFQAAPAGEQEFVANHLQLPYVVTNDLPKLQHLRQQYPKWWRP